MDHNPLSRQILILSFPASHPWVSISTLRAFMGFDLDECLTTFCGRTMYFLFCFSTHVRLQDAAFVQTLEDAGLGYSSCNRPPFITTDADIVVHPCYSIMQHHARARDQRLRAWKRVGAGPSVLCSKRVAVPLAHTASFQLRSLVSVIDATRLAVVAPEKRMAAQESKASSTVVLTPSAS